jgi:DNA-binding GntR family transcriptional regulator
VLAPGPDAAAPIFGLLLTLAGTTLQDVYDARAAIEPAAARRIAEQGDPAVHLDLAAEITLAASAVGDREAFAAASVRFHQRLVELSGNTTLTVFVGTIGEIMARHTSAVFHESRSDEAETRRMNGRAVRSYEKLLELVRAGDGPGAEDFWKRHMETVRPHLLRRADREVVDLMD